MKHLSIVSYLLIKYLYNSYSLLRSEQATEAPTLGDPKVWGKLLTFNRDAGEPSRLTTLDEAFACLTVSTVLTSLTNWGMYDVLYKYTDKDNG